MKALYLLSHFIKSINLFNRGIFKQTKPFGLKQAQYLSLTAHISKATLL